MKNVSFVESASKEFNGKYDIIALFECFHDMGDPIGVARHLRESLNEDGTVLILEPLAGKSPAENMTPLGRFIYPVSTMFCVPCAMSQNGSSVVLGAQVGETRTAECFKQAGFTSFRRETKIESHLICQATV